MGRGYGGLFWQGEGVLFIYQRGLLKVKEVLGLWGHEIFKQNLAVSSYLQSHPLVILILFSFNLIKLALHTQIIILHLTPRQPQSHPNCSWPQYLEKMGGKQCPHMPRSELTEFL